MQEKYYIFHGYGGENSLMPLAEYMQSKGHPTLTIDDQKFPYSRTGLYQQLLDIMGSYEIVFISSAHLWFDEYNYANYYGHNTNIIAAIELLNFLKPSLSVFYPHDMGCFMHTSEIKWLDLFDLVLLPYKHNVYYKLKQFCRRVEIVGWIKKYRHVEPHTDPNTPIYRPAIFPSNIISFYHDLGAEGYADWFRRFIGPAIPIKMPAGDDGVYPLLSREGFQFLEPSLSVYDAMTDYNLIIGSGHSSIIYESVFSGIPVISLLDGYFPDEVYLKELSGIQGIYPVHPEELQDFLKDINENHRLLPAGPSILDPFDFERVYQYLT